DSKKYESREEYLTPEAIIKNLYAEKETVHGELGAQVYVDIKEDEGEPKYFRYKFEETYRVIAPYYIVYNIELTNINVNNLDCYFEMIITDCNEDKNIGYVSVPSQKNILLAANAGSNGTSRFPILFIEGGSIKIRSRFSILVKQFAQTQGSYEFYKKLKDLGNIQNLLINNQPGYIKGNIYEVDNKQEKVVGYFEVSSVTEKRIYFNHNDLDLNQPNYPYNCEIESELDFRDNDIWDGDRNDRRIIHSLLEISSPPWELFKITYIQEIDDEGGIIYIPVYTFVTPECGNVTYFSSVIKPDFWED
ncbi:MAG: DUF4249 family protein, partial [Bacteroidota bacterium]